MRNHNKLRKEKFAKYYVIYEVGKTAAIKAGYSPHTAVVQAHQLLQKPDVQAMIEEFKKEQRENFKLEAQEVYENFYALATYDIDDYFDITYELKSLRKGLKGRVINLLKKYVGESISEYDFQVLCTEHQEYYFKRKDLKELSSLTKQQRAAIQGITYDRQGNPILKFVKKNDALESIARILGLYEKDNNQKNLSVNVNNRGMDDFYNDTLPNIDQDKLELRKT